MHFYSSLSEFAFEMEFDGENSTPFLPSHQKEKQEDNFPTIETTFAHKKMTAQTFFPGLDAEDVPSPTYCNMFIDEWPHSKLAQQALELVCNDKAAEVAGCTPIPSFMPTV
jgi:hypothetical protein